MKCPDCGNRDIYISSKNEAICKNCGTVIDDLDFDDGKFASDTNQNFNNNSVAGGIEIDGKIIKNFWLYSTQEKTTYNVKKEMEKVASKVDVPNYVLEDAKNLYDRCVINRLIYGKNNLIFSYSCIYASCLSNNIPKTPLEICMFSDVSIKSMMKVFRLMFRKLKLKITSCDPVDLVPRFSSRLGFNYNDIIEVNNIIDQLKKQSYISGKKPTTIMASVLYIVGKKNYDDITQRKVANITGVIEPTIRRRSREILEIIKSRA